MSSTAEHMIRLAGIAGVAVATVVASIATAQGVIPRTAAPADARVTIIDPADGATVSNPVTIRFGLAGMGVAPATIDYPNSGHHHLIIDAPLPATDVPVPADEKHRHFGKGQTQVTLDLAPGTHTLQLLLGDLNHVPHDPPVASQQITIHVE